MRNQLLHPDAFGVAVPLPMRLRLTGRIFLGRAPTLRKRTAHVTTCAVSNSPGQSSFQPAVESAGKSWEDVRAASDIQFAPLPPQAPKPPPAWIKWLEDHLQQWFEPLARWLGMSWPTLEWVLLGIGVLLALLVAWRLLSPLLQWRPKKAQEEERWAPDRDEALALLEDADALAAAGRFDEATHLLLIRSVGQIRAVRPNWLGPSSTAREIAALPALPSGAKSAFTLIAERVERSLFALRSLNADDWTAARGAYAEFALADLGRDAPA